MNVHVTEAEIAFKDKVINERKNALKWGTIFLISSIIDFILLAIIIATNLPLWLFIPIAIIEILKRMYSTLFGWDCTDYNIGNSGLWFLWGLFLPSISLIFASRHYMLKAKYRIR